MTPFTFDAPVLEIADPLANGEAAAGPVPGGGR
jgi:hypothetical protein